MLTAVTASYRHSLNQSVVCFIRKSLRIAKIIAKDLPSTSVDPYVTKCSFIAFGSVHLLGNLVQRSFCNYVQDENLSISKSPWLISSETVKEVDSGNKHFRHVSIFGFIVRFWQMIVFTVKISLRICSLSIYFVPLLLTYPLLCLSEKTRTYWWRFAIWVMRSSGPTLIKLGQWASTRRDLFSKEFCDKMAVLHNRISDIGWRHSRSLVDELFNGVDWESFITEVVPTPVGSGCIAQVYKAKMDLHLFKKCTGSDIDVAAGKRVADVAIKIAKPKIRERIEIDLTILRALVHVAQTFIPGLFFVNPLSSLKQFEIVLKRQVDLRNEAKALERFSRNFDPELTHVRFPKVYCYSKDVIIESFEDGIPVNKVVTDEVNYCTRQSKAVKSRIALLGARAILKMIFVDNFVHGDLHPGNILIRFNDNCNGDDEVHKSPFEGNFILKAAEFVKTKFRWFQEPCIKFTNDKEYEDEPTLVILDTGIAIEETPDNLRNLRALFAAIFEKRGFDAGKLLLKHSPQNNCSNPDDFCHEVERIVKIARSSSSLRKLEISQLLNELFSIVSGYQVGLETSFATVVLAVMVLEGLGRSLDPDLDLFQCAYPYLFSGVLY